MYSKVNHTVLGFHGCDRSVGENVLLGKNNLDFSRNAYDWLGHGIYFWENDPSRALTYAKSLMKHPGRVKTPIAEPFVIGAVIDLGYCLNLLENLSLEVLKAGYGLLQDAGVDLPVNKPIGADGDLLLRDLDCAVIQAIHSHNENNGITPFDSVRGAFWEGPELYPNAGFREKSHIQICIRNPNCIKGYFLPRDLSSGHPKP